MRRQTRSALLTGVQTCDVPICGEINSEAKRATGFKTLVILVLGKWLSDWGWGFGFKATRHAQKDGGERANQKQTDDQRNRRVYTSRNTAEIGRAAGRERVCQYV